MAIGYCDKYFSKPNIYYYNVNGVVKGDKNNLSINLTDFRNNELQNLFNTCKFLKSTNQYNTI